ncbi:MAG TPA: helix-turn-helix domain-containing protein [Dehalococcoidia bacterium]|nr:helix-turn-helix domain-containing protein [Dehalococcoidia bacterium]
MSTVEDYIGRMFTVNEVARLLNVHPATVRRWEKERQLKSYRLGPKKVIRFRTEELYSFINHNNDPDAQ